MDLSGGGLCVQLMVGCALLMRLSPQVEPPQRPIKGGGQLVREGCVSAAGASIDDWRVVLGGGRKLAARAHHAERRRAGALAGLSGVGPKRLSRALRYRCRGPILLPAVKPRGGETRRVERARRAL